MFPLPHTLIHVAQNNTLNTRKHHQKIFDTKNQSKKMQSRGKTCFLYQEHISSLVRKHRKPYIETKNNKMQTKKQQKRMIKYKYTLKMQLCNT